MTTREPRDIPIAADGVINVAPVGTTLPTEVGDSLDAAFKQLGYVSEDGLTFTPNVSTDGIPAWQSLAMVRTFVNTQDLQISADILQWNENTLKTFFGGGTYTAGLAGKWTFDLPLPAEIVEQSVIVQATDPNGSAYWLVFERMVVVETGEPVFSRTGASMLPTTLRALAGTGGRTGKILGLSVSKAT